MLVTRPLVFTILLMGIFGITEVVSTKRGRRIRPSIQAYQNQNLPNQQSYIPQNNYYTPTSGYSTTSAQKPLPVRPAAPRPGIVVFGVGPHSLQIPNQYSNFPVTSYQSGKSIPQLPNTPQNTAATKPGLKPNPTISVAAKPMTYQQNAEPAKSSNPVQHAQPVKSPQYGNKIPTINAPHKRPSPPAIPKVTVVKVPENVPVYVSPIKSTVYGSAYVSDPSNNPASNIYTKGETLSYQTTTPSSTSKSSVSSSNKETKAYQTTEAYSKTTTKSEIKENHSTPSRTVEVSETYAKKEESNTKKEETYVKKEESNTKKEETYKKKEESNTKKEETYAKKEDSKINESKSKSPVYPEPQSYKEVESLPVTENKKKEDASSSFHSAAQSKPASEESSKTNSYEVSSVEESKPKTPIYPFPPAESLQYNEEKKKFDAPAYVSSIHQTVQKHQPSKESYDTNRYQESYVDESEPKGSEQSASLSHKEVESLPYTENKKKYDSPSQKPLNESSKKNKNNESYSDESKLKTPVYSAQQSYKEVESLPHTENKKKQNVPDYLPTLKPYQPKSAPVTKLSHSANEGKFYSQSKPTELPVLSTKTTKPLEYSTESTSTTPKYRIPSQDQSKSYYVSTTSKYQESTTYSSLATSTQKQKGYTSSTSYEKIPVATTQGYSSNTQYSNKAYNTKATLEPVSVASPYVGYSSIASPNNHKSNDRVYVVSDKEDENWNTYQKPGPSSDYQSSYSNSGRDQSVGDRSSTVKPVSNEYKSSIEKSSSSKDYTSSAIVTENKTNYKARPVASPADYLSTYISKPIEKTDSTKTFAAVADNYKTDDHGGSENERDYSAIPGVPGTDYPIFSELPNDQFNCSEQRLPGYYADVSARCQVFHICLGDRQWSFLCPNGTIFSQEHFVCVWWYEFDCSKATNLYDLNEKLFVISSNEQTTEGEYENQQYGKSAVSEISTISDQDYRSSKTNEESVFATY